MKNSKKKNNLDEMQEQALLKIESRSYSLAFWLLLIAIVVQTVLDISDLGEGIPLIAGEWIVFMVLCVYMSVSCLRNNIWDRRLKPTAGTNFILSLIGGVVSGAMVAIPAFIHTAESPDRIIVTAAIFAAVTIFGTLIVFAALTVCSKAFIKNSAKAENAEDEEEAD